MLKALAFRPEIIYKTYKDFIIINIPIFKLQMDFEEVEKARHEISNSEAVIIMSKRVSEIIVPKIVEDLKNKKVIAVGPATAKKLLDLGLEVYIPKSYNSKAISQLIREMKVSKAVALRSADAEEEFRENVIEFKVYKAYPIERNIAYSKYIIKKEKINFLFITSSLIGKIFREKIYSERDGNYCIVCIGEMSSKYIRDLNPIIANESTFDGLIKKSLEYLSNC
jgi:Uroporphyrinogen-III synthase